MSENTSIQMAQSKTTESFGVYDAPTEGPQADAIVGTYIAEEAAEQLGEYIEITVGEGENLDLTLDKETSGYGVFSDAADAIEASYIGKELLAEVTGQDADSDDFEVPDEIAVTARPSDESEFEEAADNSEAREEAANTLVADADADDSEDEPSTDEAADELVAGAPSGADPNGEVDVATDETETVEVSDDEIGLE